MKNKLFKILPYIFIIILASTSITFFVQKKNLEYEIRYSGSIADVELKNYLVFDENGVGSGDLTGFVKFNNIGDQPKTLRQYVTIKALDRFETELGQIFSITDTIVVDGVPPREFLPVLVFIDGVEEDLIIFSDSEQNRYGFNNQTGEAFIFDNTGDNTSLVTDSVEYQKFMFNFIN